MPEKATITTPRPDSGLNTAELVARIKTYGNDPSKLYGLFVKARDLRPEISLPEFRSLFEIVTPNAYIDSVTVDFVPTHVDQDGFQIMVTQRLPEAVQYILRYGADNFSSAGDPIAMFESRWSPINAAPVEPAPVPTVDEGARVSFPWFVSYFNHLLQVFYEREPYVSRSVDGNTLTIVYDEVVPPPVWAVWKKLTNRRGLSTAGTDRNAGRLAVTIRDERQLPEVGDTVYVMPTLSMRNYPKQVPFIAEVVGVSQDGNIRVIGSKDERPITVWALDIDGYIDENGELTEASNYLPDSDRVTAFLNSGELDLYVA